MSTTITTDVFCDGPDCFAWIDGVSGPGVDRPGARARARQYGWVHRKGKDLCPECVSRHALSAEVQPTETSPVGPDRG